MRKFKPEKIFFLIAILGIGVAGCVTDITRNPSIWTDFIPGQTYQLKQSVYIEHGYLMKLEHPSIDNEGQLVAGTKLIVRKIEIRKSLEIGTVTHIFAEILSGAHQGKIV